MNSQRTPMLQAFFKLFLVIIFLPIQSAFAQWSIPEELQSQLSKLNPEQIEFLSSGTVLKFVPEQQIAHELATRDAESLRALIDDLTWSSFSLQSS